MPGGEGSRNVVAGTIQRGGLHMDGAGEYIVQQADQLGGQVLIEKQLHATATRMLRSR